MTTHEARRLKQELAAQERGRGKRYDRALRERIVAFAAERRSQGRSWAAIATELGARFETVRRWCQAKRPTAPTALALRPVEVVAERASTPLAIVTRSGLRVEGATIDDVIALLRVVG
ncbi:MAG: hypothetical protein U0270_15770 [Labilithrix sp.]|jgi:transposase-like protein